MIYFSADDYGLCSEASAHIQQCIDAGALNKVSVFPNFDKPDLNEMLKKPNVMVCLHLNLVEGKCVANAKEINLIADEKGVFKHTFGGLFKLGLLRKKEFEEQLYKEIKAQVLYWKSLLPQDTPLCIDSHQHTHMIPSVFKALIKVLKDEKINLGYMRIPCEPLIPYIKTPSLYSTYSAVNIIKQWLLNLLWLKNKKHAKSYKIPTAYFMGILFSGKMDEKRVSKILPQYIKMAEKSKSDIEILFHAGYLKENKAELKKKNIVFESFYISENRKTEFDSVMKIKERSVENALY